MIDWRASFFLFIQFIKKTNIKIFISRVISISIPFPSARNYHYHNYYKRDNSGLKRASSTRNAKVTFSLAVDIHRHFYSSNGGGLNVVFCFFFLSIFAPRSQITKSGQRTAEAAYVGRIQIVFCERLSIIAWWVEPRFEWVTFFSAECVFLIAEMINCWSGLISSSLISPTSWTWIRYGNFLPRIKSLRKIFFGFHGENSWGAVNEN